MERTIFISNELVTKSQHAYRVVHSTNSAIVHMTDECFKEMDNKRIVGTVMLDFSAAFDIIRRQRMLSMEAHQSTKMSSVECLKEAVWVLFYFLPLPMTFPMFWNRQKL